MSAALALAIALGASPASASGKVVVPPLSAPIGAVPVAGAAAVAIGPQLSLPLPMTALRASVPVPRLEIGARVSPTLGKSFSPLFALAHAGDPRRHFDGERRPESIQLELPLPGLARTTYAKPEPDAPPRYLSIADAEHGRWLADVTRVAWGSRTARRVLAQAEQLARSRGRPITVLVSELRANNGEYVYDWDMVRIGEHYLKKDPIDAAPTLVHELLHVVQKAQLLPTDALEMELEAIMVTLEVMRELGVPFERASFYKRAYDKFKGPLPEFIDWLAKEYDTNIPLVRSRLSSYVAELERRREKTRRRIERWDRKIKAAAAAAAEMERTSQDARAIEVFRNDALAKLQAPRNDEQGNLAWLERDLQMLSTPEGRRRYRAYARRVMDYTRGVHARYNAARDTRP